MLTCVWRSEIETATICAMPGVALAVIGNRNGAIEVVLRAEPTHGVHQEMRYVNQNMLLSAHWEVISYDACVSCPS